MARTSTSGTSAAVVGLSTHYDGPKVDRRWRRTLPRDQAELVKAALDLWSERGFETGIDSTTAEEIAAGPASPRAPSTTSRARNRSCWRWAG